MEEQTLPWWKRALRAAIGTLRSGFGLFGKPQQEVVAAAAVEMHEAAVSDSEPVVESITKAEPEIAAAEIVEIKEEEIEAELPDELIDVVAMPESIETSEPEVVVVPEAEIEEEVVEEPEPEIEEVVVEDPAEEIAVEESEAEDAAVVETEGETEEAESEIEEVVIAEPEVEVEGAESEAVEELVEVQEVEEETEPEKIAVETTEQAEEELEVDDPVVEETEADVEPEVEVEQESAHEVTMETVPEAAEEFDQQEDLSDVEHVEVAAESVAEITDEIEEMKPLQEETFPEPESVNTESPVTDTPGVEAESEATQVIEAESVPDVSSVEVAEAEATPEADAVPVQIAATAEPEATPVVEAPAEPHMIKHVIKEDDDKSSPFSIIVSQVYEGPMDLLLDLIRKQDIDIYDIPIAKITEQFLAYVERLRASDMDMAGEFIYTASLLIHIKSKTLLPRAPSGPDDQYEDPRRELVERLLEHERFKNAAQMLQQKQMIEDATWTNPGSREFKGDSGTEPELAADTVDLVRVFREILDRARNRPVINVEEDAVTVGQMIQFLGRRLNMEDRPIALRKLLAHTHSQRALVAMFLALLELVRLQAVLLRQDKLFSEIFIKKHEGFDNVMTEGFLAARDDWN